ncbi:MAG: FAD-dependent oxidoreductase, partial [Cytophagaceae bacterium]
MTKFIDATQVANASILDTDVCIVGAGAAGITLATQLSKRGVEVTVLEGGADRITGESQGLYRAEQTGLPYFDLTSCRLRFLGGTTNHWSGFCRENDPIDYEARPELGMSAWPVGYSKIRPYVEAAATMLGLDATVFNPHDVLLKLGLSTKDLLDTQSGEFETKLFLMAKNLRFKDVFRAQMEAHPRVRLIMNASVTGVRLRSDGQAVQHVDVMTPSRHAFKVRARRFILAAHAVENARLLLASNDVHAEGIGNQHDHVGRYFMEHPHVMSGLFFPSNKLPSLYSMESVRRLNLNANLGLSRQAMERRQVLQYYCRLLPVYDFRVTEKALKRVADGFWEPMDMRMLRALARVTQRPLESARAAAHHLKRYQPKPVAYSLDHRIEQAPNPSSRVTLSDERDALGVPKVRLHWQLNDIDYRTFAEGQRVVASELGRLGMGQFKLEEMTPDVVNSGVEGHYHHDARG